MLFRPFSSRAPRYPVAVRLVLSLALLALAGCGREDPQIAQVTTDERRALGEAEKMIGVPTAPASEMPSGSPSR